MPRHPSQLYEACLEGIVLFLVLLRRLALRGGRRRPGLLSGVFVIGYGVARIVGEFFREPDAQLGYLVGGADHGPCCCRCRWCSSAWLADHRAAAAGGRRMDAA